MLKNYIDFAFIVIDSVITVLLLHAMCSPKQAPYKATAIMAIILSIENILFANVLANMPLLNLVPVATLLIYALLFLDGRLTKKIISVGIVFVSIIIINSIFIVIGSFFSASAWNALYKKGDYLGYMLAIASKLFLYLEYKYIEYKNKNFEFSTETWRYIITILILSFVAIATALNEYINRNATAWHIGVIIIVSVFVNILIFTLCVKMTLQAIEKRNQAIYIKSIEYEEKILEIMEIQKEELKNLIHDHKNHFNILEKLIQSDNKNSAKEYIENIKPIEPKEYIHTNNVVMDYILNSKIEMAQKAGIEVRKKINIYADSNLDNSYIGIILGNLLDNAIEACREVDGQKYIDIKIKIDEYRTIYTILNTTKVKELAINGKLKTTKTDKDKHGHGLESVKKAVEKNDGEFIYDVNDYIFKCVCIIPNIQSK